MGFMVCDRYPLLATRIRVSDVGPNDRLVVCKIDFSHMGNPAEASSGIQKIIWASTQENLSSGVCE